MLTDDTLAVPGIMHKNKKKNKIKHIRAVKGGKYSIREKRKERKEDEER